ncbi:NAD-dependent epimerase/dehydratase family protein [Candidatus Parcubacteria bacterium]|nr:NAD-dependent epimerase/dehydratase family protein [Candidatus Parcubacteria bacterium]
MINFKNKKIFVAGGTGFLGKRIVKRLKEERMDFVTTSLSMGVDFRDKRQIEKFFEKERPEIIINCAAYVGGIKFGLEHEGEIFYNNALINTNLIECARKYNIKRYINPISNCSYPDVVQKDFKEEEWWDGPLHPSVLVYGFIKKATWVQSYAYHNQYKMDFINFLVPNMYGPNDHFNEVRSHALGALVMKVVKAEEENLPEVIIWGTGEPIREWLYIDDCVEAFIRALEIPSAIELINIGQGKGISIGELAKMIKEIVGYKGKLVFDISKPDGAPYKVMNVERMEKIFNWLPPTKLENGIKKTVDWYYKNIINNN